MRTTRMSRLDSITTLTEQIARLEHLPPEGVVPFYDASDFLTALFNRLAHDRPTVYAAGHVTPDIMIAADKAGLTVTETLGPSPFAADLDALLDRVRSATDIIYLAHPNRVSGITWGARELETIAQVVPEGTLIIDEELLSFHGTSAASLTENHPRVVILRSLTAPFGLTKARYGYAVAHPLTVRRHLRALGNRLPTSARKLIESTLTNNDTRQRLLHTVREESLRLGTALSALGIQNHVTPTDFLLFRVADPRLVGDSLTAAGVAVENLDGYPLLKHYLRYRLRSPQKNDDFIRAMQRMPRAYYFLENRDTRPTTLHRQGEQAKPTRPPSRVRRSDKQTEVVTG
ncbi:MAG: aminotransferase class I/II-fold pyridoxal phosphate-dependent enzyme [Candidatus Zixiibacteriota bacterium]|nr:MAG: aminotransferase class I/II-fold pyridoxal phosphate-dependent enzyme [candidate division Zixibacteria bacterium]